MKGLASSQIKFILFLIALLFTVGSVHSEPAVNAKSETTRPWDDFWGTSSQTRTSQASTGQAQNRVKLVAARFIRLDRINDQTYLTFEAVYGQGVADKNQSSQGWVTTATSFFDFEQCRKLVSMSHASEATQKWLNHFPVTKSYQVKLDEGELPNFLRKGNIVDIELQNEAKTLTYANEGITRYDEFPTVPLPPVDCSLITSVKKSNAVKQNTPWCVLRHMKSYDRSGEFVFSDGTIIVVESVNPQVVASGILSEQELARLRAAIGACHFGDFALAPEYLAGGEYIMDENCQALLFTGANAATADEALRSALSRCHKTVLSSAQKRLFYANKHPADGMGPPYTLKQGTDGIYHPDSGISLSKVAKDFPDLDGIHLSAVGPEGLHISNKTVAEHKDFFNNTNLKIINMYWREGSWIYDGVELDCEPLPPVKLLKEIEPEHKNVPKIHASPEDTVERDFS